MRFDLIEFLSIAMETKFENWDSKYLKPLFGGRITTGTAEGTALLPHASDNTDTRESPLPH